MLQQKQNATITYTGVETPIGLVFAAFSRGALYRISSGTETEFLQNISPTAGEVPIRADSILNDYARQILAVFTGDTPAHLPLYLETLTPFQQKVLNMTAKIPRGQVRSYGWIAQAIGSPNAHRAVGTALAQNPLPFVIPCHRVVRADGQLGSYSGGGTAVKARLLTLEEVPVAQAAGKFIVPKPFEPIYQP
ncbi:methylated-DNA/protein-cysteine methyltransferase [Halothiobacillus neapolitanus c2]|uniref:methylated-DNA--[protein]-cysteine S-methyltransferase n=1 Tax=Halothiobacillus neapolitanus (strain ATCC 23641 / DSM 15147 / CIP 104769 / NCIMB 8539 / c2) TaxID=555778 RepID=D0L227_HALNC|nr:methylated-DNA/protein-cysteine methyltransferase [Halothiobacillus neapolitanus c2]TDN65141.1 methylated-DNA-[protein]-cysteine S-methyltransferase [Halothiobacillus neapolitanus]